MVRRSGARRRARAETGGPVVLMWWVVLCLGGSVMGCSCVRVGKSERRAANSFCGGRGRREGLGVDAVDEMP